MPAIFTTPVFDVWFERLRDRRAAARIQARIDRAESGNLGDCTEVVILLVGGGKATQAKDIARAKELAKQV